MSVVDPNSGEISDGPDVEMVPLNLAALDEEALLAQFPTPVQAAGALLKARDAARRAPAALDQYRRTLRNAERDLVIATALAAEELLLTYPRMAMTERKDLARATSQKVKDAESARDTAWLLLEYARDWDRALGRDIDILRSLNANFRGEHS